VVGTLLGVRLVEHEGFIMGVTNGMYLIKHPEGELLKRSISVVIASAVLFSICGVNKMADGAIWLLAFFLIPLEKVICI